MDNVSKNRAAEQALRESEMRFTAIVQTAPDAIISIDEDQRIILFNKGAEDTFGYQSDEVLGKPMDMLMPERFRGVHEQGVADFAASRETARYMSSRNDITCLKKNGEEFAAEASISRIEASGQKVMSVILRDISERNQAALALAESESKFRTLAESATVGIFLFRDRVLYANQACSEMTGYSRKQLLHMGLADLLHPDSLSEVQRNWAKRKQGDAASRHCDVQFLTKSGEVRWGQLTTAMIYFEGLPASLGSVVDITDRIRAKATLRESEEKYRSLFDNALDMIHIVGEDGRISDVNDTELDALGYTRAELIGKPLADIVHPDYREITKKAFAQTMQGKPIGIYETAFITSDGEKIDIEVNVSPQMEAGKFISGRAICRDITKRKRAEEQLSEQRRSMQAILDNAPVGIWLLGMDHRIKFINSTFCNAVGVEERLFLEAEHYSKLLPEDVSRGCTASDKDCFDTRAQVSSIEEIPCVDGKLHSFEIIKAPILDDQGVMQGLVALATDITGFKQKEASILRLSNENRRLAQRLLRVQEQERQGLARELHDELGQSLAMIKTELGRAASRVWNRKELTGIIRTIDETTDQVIATTRAMLQRLRPTTIGGIGLPGVLAELAKNWEEQQGIPCAFDSSGDLDDLNENIQFALFRILQESLTNIARHARARQVQVYCHSHTSSGDGDKPRDAVTLIVADDGVGLQGKRKSHQELGLIGMRERAHAIGGKFDIESAPNKGTRILVTIPLTKEASS